MNHSSAKITKVLVTAIFFYLFSSCGSDEDSRQGSALQTDAVTKTGRHLANPWLWWDYQSLVSFVGIPGKDGKDGYLCAYVATEYDARLPTSLKSENFNNRELDWQLAIFDKWRLFADKEKTFVSAPLSEFKINNRIRDTTVRHGFSLDEILGILGGLRDLTIGAGSLGTGALASTVDGGTLATYILFANGSAMLLNGSAQITNQIYTAFKMIKPFDDDESDVDVQSFLAHKRDRKLTRQQYDALVSTVKKLSDEYKGEDSCPSGYDVLMSMMPQIRDAK